MGMYTFAAIDIGSNAARLLIKDILTMPDGTVKFNKVLFMRFPLRLGDDVFTKGIVGEKKEKLMLHMIKAFKQLMYINEVQKYRACATSAMREAKNGEKLIKSIEKQTGIKINIISGSEEAGIIYGNHIEHATQEQRTCAYVDVGGGSTEVTMLRKGQVLYTMSYNIGTIRMLNIPGEQSYNTLSSMKADLASVCADWGEVDIIGSGGNINHLYKMADSTKKDGYLEISVLKNLCDKLEDLSVDERMDKYALKPDRADVIVPAARIFLNVASAINAKRIFVPKLGLADGIIDNLYLKKTNMLKEKGK